MKRILVYGTLGGVLIALLKYIEYAYVVRTYPTEIYGGLIALLFTGIGLHLGLRSAKPEQVVVVREVRVRESGPFVRKEAALAELGLTQREHEILSLIAAGLGNREIGEKLFVSENTVKTHCGPDRDPRIGVDLQAQARTARYRYDGHGVAELYNPRLRAAEVERMSRIACVLLMALSALGADWPEWRGAGRAGVWSEDGILERFPEGGLRYTWRVPIHEGYSGPAVAGGRVFVTDFVRGKDMAGTERALALDERTGKELWKHEWPVNYAGTQAKWASGPRATPTVDGDLVFLLGGAGKLLALEAQSGKPVWQHDFVAEYRATLPAWGTVGAPIVDGPRLIALVGGENGALVVAFDKRTGKEIWRALPAKGDAGYAPPILIQAGGVRQLIVWHPSAVSSLDPESGRVFWEQPFETGMSMTVATPVFDGRRLLISSFFDGSMLLELDAARPAARALWQKKGPSELPEETESLHALITSPVLDGESIYGIDSYGELRRLRTADGERIWASMDLVREKARWACGFLVRQGSRYFVNTDRGELVIAQLTPESYREIDRTPLIQPTTQGGGKRELEAVLWSHPAYANRHIVVRNDREIVRASLEASPPIVVLSDFDNPPFASWKEGAAEPEGLEPEIVREIAAALGRPLRWDRRPFRDLLPALAAGEGDLISATLGITEERAKLVAFSRPYFHTRIAVVVRTGPGEPESLADLAGQRVGASRGTTSEAAVLRSLPRAVPVLDPEKDASFEALVRSGRIRAAVMDGPAADRLVREHPEVLRRLAQDLGEERYAFAVGLKERELLAAIDRVLATLEASGRMGELRQRHGLGPAR